MPRCHLPRPYALIQYQSTCVSNIRYDTIGEFNVDWKAEYSALCDDWYTVCLQVRWVGSLGGVPAVLPGMVSRLRRKYLDKLLHLHHGRLLTWTPEQLVHKVIFILSCYCTSTFTLRCVWLQGAVSLVVVWTVVYSMITVYMLIRRNRRAARQAVWHVMWPTPLHSSPLLVQTTLQQQHPLR